MASCRPDIWDEAFVQHIDVGAVNGHRTSAMPRVGLAAIGKLKLLCDNSAPKKRQISRVTAGRGIIGAKTICDI